MGHRCHDYKNLALRWRAVARDAGIRLQTIASADGLPVLCLKSPALEKVGGIYLSAGIHGDEPGGTEGLVAWADKHRRSLRSLPVLIFPCLNPWGLTQNRRSDSDGHDLNRLFHNDRNPAIAAVRKIAAQRRFNAALMLHEDYDGEGVYLYEHHNCEPWGDSLLRAAEAFVPRDPRTRIERRLAKSGVLSPRVTARTFAKIGLPEAVFLHGLTCNHSITFETPSEFALEKRTAAHVAVIEKLVSLCG